jgi:DNA-binding LacI/PurR family transcriptional regulator
MRKKVTLREIAQAAGVSIPTVSRVLNESAKVHPDIVNQVRAAATKLGVAIQSPSRRRAIAFLLGNRPITHPFHSHVMLGAEAYCTEHDYSVVFLALHYPLYGQIRQLPTPRLLEKRGAVDGFMLAGVNSASLVELLVNTGLPCSVYATTLVDDDNPDGCGKVWTDDAGGAAEVTRHLLALGHERIGWVGNCRYPWFRRRSEGYRSTMEKSGNEAQVVSMESDEEHQVGYVGAKTILDNPGHAGLTAFAAGNDRVAHGVYEALRDLNLTTGRDVSVTGFNDTLEAVILHPTLTTMRVFAEQVGRRLAEQVIARIEGNAGVSQAISVPTQLVRRDSCLRLRSIT